MCHNRGGNVLLILQEKMALIRKTSEEAKTSYHLIVEEYDRETLIHEAAISQRQWFNGIKYCSFSTTTNELENKFKIVKLGEVLWCSNETSGVTKSTQNFLRHQNSIFKREMDEVTFKQ